MVESIFSKLIEWVWLPLLGAIVGIYFRLDGKLLGMRETQSENRGDADKRLTLLETHYLNIEAKMTAFDTRRREDRQEIMDRLERHSETMYAKIDKLNEKIDQLISQRT